MAYIAIAAGQVDAESPIDTTYMVKVKDNFDSHETRILAWEAGGSVTQDKLGYSAGDVLMISSDVDSTVLITATLTILKEAKVSRTGTLRIKFTMVHGWASGTIPITGQIYRSRDGNSTAVGTLRTMVGTDPDTEFSEDVSGWAPGDLVQIKCTAYNSGHSNTIKNFRIYTAYYQAAESITVP